MKITIVLPTKNQTAKLLVGLNKIKDYFDQGNIDYDVLIVTDGSDEPNQKAMEAAAPSFPLNVRLLPYENHSGKGHNVQRGFLAADGDYVLFMDADLSTDLEIFDEIKPDLGKYDAFITSRHTKGSLIETKQGLVRRTISSLSRFFIRKRFHFKGLTDTQCGYKLFRASVAKEMAKRQVIDGFAFDVEYLYFLSLNGYSVKELPVKWADDANSTIKSPLKTSLDFMKDMKKIKKNKNNYILTEEEKEALKASDKEKAEEVEYVN